MYLDRVTRGAFKIVLLHQKGLNAYYYTRDGSEIYKGSQDLWKRHFRARGSTKEYN